MNKKVLITGGSRGIGKGLVEAFSKAGYSVFFCYHSSHEEAEALSKKFGCKAFSVDFSSLNAVSDFADSFLEEFGGVDVLINNAALAHYGLIQDVTVEDLQKLFAVNVQSAFCLTKNLVSPMIANQKGCIINVASMWGETGASCEVLYSATKGAVIAFTKSLAKELAPSGISVNCISPGVVDTDMLSHLSDADKMELAKEIPLGRFCETDEIVQLALYLASAAPSLTGQILGINGGMYC